MSAPQAPRHHTAGNLESPTQPSSDANHTEPAPNDVESRDAPVLPAQDGDEDTASTDGDGTEDMTWRGVPLGTWPNLSKQQWRLTRLRRERFNNKNITINSMASSIAPCRLKLLYEVRHTLRDHIGKYRWLDIPASSVVKTPAHNAK